MKKYLVSFWACAIEEIEVISETTAFVVMIDDFLGGQRRVAKEKDGHVICDTWSDAKNALYVEADIKMKAANQRMQEAKEYLAKIDRQTKVTA